MLEQGYEAKNLSKKHTQFWKTQIPNESKPYQFWQIPLMHKKASFEQEKPSFQFHKLV